MSAQTGQLDTAFLGSTIVKPNDFTEINGKGDTATAAGLNFKVAIGNRGAGGTDGRTFTRPKTGSVKIFVDAAGQPTDIREDSPTNLSLS